GAAAGAGGGRPRHRRAACPRAPAGAAARAARDAPRDRAPPDGDDRRAGLRGAPRAAERAHAPVDGAGESAPAVCQGRGAAGGRAAAVRELSPAGRVSDVGPEGATPPASEPPGPERAAVGGRAPALRA